MNRVGSPQKNTVDGVLYQHEMIYYSYWKLHHLSVAALAEVIHYPLCIHVIFYPSKKAFSSSFQMLSTQRISKTLSMQRSRSLLAFGSLFTLLPRQLWLDTYIKQVDNLSKLDNHNASGGAWCLICQVEKGGERHSIFHPTEITLM